MSTFFYICAHNLTTAKSPQSFDKPNKEPRGIIG